MYKELELTSLGFFSVLLGAIFPLLTAKLFYFSPQYVHFRLLLVGSDPWDVISHIEYINTHRMKGNICSLQLILQLFKCITSRLLKGTISPEFACDCKVRCIETLQIPFTGVWRSRKMAVSGMSSLNLKMTQNKVNMRIFSQ